jgi:hypothetical protein
MEPFEDTLRASCGDVTHIMRTLWRVIAEGRASSGWPDVSIDFEKRQADYERVRDVIGQLGDAVNAVLFEHADHRQDPVLTYKCGMDLHELRSLLDQLHARWRFQDEDVVEASGSPPPPLGVTPKELAALQRLRLALKSAIVDMPGAEDIEEQPPTAAASPQPPAVPAKTIDPEGARVLDRLRRAGKWVQVALMEYMLKQESAPIDEVKQHVYPDQVINDAGVRQRVYATNKSLETMESPLRLYNKSHWVHLRRSPE